MQKINETLEFYAAVYFHLVKRPGGREQSVLSPLFWRLWSHFATKSMDAELQKEPFLCTLKILKFRFWAVFCSIFTKTEPESALRLGFRQTFFSGILQSLRASEKNSVDFRKNIFHAYFGCKIAIARDRNFEVKTVFWRDLRAHYGNRSE